MNVDANKAQAIIKEKRLCIRLLDKALKLADWQEQILK